MINTEGYKEDPLSNNLIKMTDDTFRDSKLIERFHISQKYMLPINDAVDNGSVTYTVVTSIPGTPKLKFYHAFRRFLIATLGRGKLTEYCYKANIMEVLQSVN